MKSLSILFLAFSGLTCSHKMYSPEIQSNMKVFETHLKEVIDAHEGKSVLVEEYRQALFFLDFVTGIPMKASYSSTIGYYNEEDYKENIKDWKNWYKKNKDKLTNMHIDSTYGKVSKPLGY